MLKRLSGQNYFGNGLLYIPGEYYMQIIGIIRRKLPRKRNNLSKFKKNPRRNENRKKWIDEKKNEKIINKTIKKELRKKNKKIKKYRKKKKIKILFIYYAYSTAKNEITIFRAIRGHIGGQEGQNAQNIVSFNSPNHKLSNDTPHAYSITENQNFNFWVRSRLRLILEARWYFQWACPCSW